MVFCSFKLVTRILQTTLIHNCFELKLKEDFISMKQRMWCAREVFYHLHQYISHTKLKDSLKTRTEPAVLCVYVENQAILEPILLYRASKCKQT